MILYNQLHFFNKRGNDLNLSKERYVIVSVIRNETYEKFNAEDFVDAEVDAITNEYGKIEFLYVVNSGAGYDDKTVVKIEDLETKVSYEIEAPYIDIDEETGAIIGVTMPQDMTGFSFPSIVWKGSIFLEKVSTGLIASDQIYVLEEMFKYGEEATDETTVYTSPRSYTDNAGHTSSTISARFKSDEYEEEEDAINLFTVDYLNDTKPVVEVSDTISVDLEDGTKDEVSSFGVRKIKYKKSTAIAFNVMLTTEYEGVFERTIEIYEEIEGNIYTYAEILIHGETEGEDERLKLALENFGISISEAEEKIFRDSSVNEDLHDYRLLNQKRKEMLLEYHNIFPFMGSYKGLVNMINYFGYDDLKLKEYWLNTDLSVSIKKVKGHGYPFELTRLHRYSIDNSHSGLMSFSNFELTEGTEVPVYKLPKISDDNVDPRDNSITDLPKIENGVVKGKVVNELEEHIDFKQSYDQDILQKKRIDDNLAAKVIRRESYKIEDVAPEDLQYTQVEVPMQLAQKGKDYDSESMLPTEYWKKTNMFGLFYDIVRETGEYDEEGMPVTEDAFMYSEDEILIKLFGLREYLKEKFMPVNARIVDIVGEGAYYYRTDINTWKDDCTIFTVNKNDSIDFDIIPTTNNYINDLHDYGELEKKPESSTVVDTLREKHPNNLRLEEFADYSALDKAIIFTSTLDTSNLEEASWNKARRYLVEARDINRELSIEYQSTIDEALDALVSVLKELKTKEGEPIDVPVFFKDGDNKLIEKPWNEFKNNEGPVGCEVTLKLKDFNVTWDDMTDTWDELNDTNWLSLETKNYVDVEWKISYKPAKGDGRTFEIEDRGSISDYTKTQSFKDYEELVATLNNSKQDDWNVNNNLVFAEQSNIKKRFYISSAEESYEPYGQDQSPWSEEEFEQDVEYNEKYFDGLKIGFFRIKEIPDGIECMTTKSHKTFKVVLPYAGDYAVQCSVYDYSNTPISKTVTYTVDMYKADFFIFGRSLENQVQTWNEANFTWDQANIQWRTSGKENDLTWDDLDGVTWDDLDFSRYTRQFNPFDTEMRSIIKSISEADRYVGVVESVEQSKDLQVVTLRGCNNVPPLRSGIDKVIARDGAAMASLSVIDVTYDEEDEKTTLTLSKESTVTLKTDVLREVCGDVVLEGDNISNRINGINQGKYLLLRSMNFDELKRSSIRVKNPVYVGSKIAGIEIETPVTVIPREFGYLYEKKTFNVTSDIIDPVNKTIKIESKLEVDEIVPGFTIIKIDCEADKSHRLLVKKYLGDSTYKVVELDSDMGTITTGTGSYEFHKMTVKVSQNETEKTSSTVMLNFNDYPLNEAFKEDAAHWNDEEQQVNWYFDYIVKDGSFSVEVESYSLTESGDTQIHLKDTYNELLQASTRFLVSWSSFDEEYAEVRYGTEIFKWENFDEVCWDDFKHLTWNMLDYFQAPRCGFEIHAIASGGTIQFNEQPRFQFKKLKSNNDWEGACEELNSTENEALCKFTYRVLEDADGKFIQATAKNEGAVYLGYLRFGNGVTGSWNETEGISHTYPRGDYEDWIDPYIYGLNNKYAMWHPVARPYYEYGVKEATRDKYGVIDENEVIRGWYPATRIYEKAPKRFENIPEEDDKLKRTSSRFEDCTYKWNEKTVLDNIDNFRENQALYFERGEDANALYGQFPSLLNSVKWRYDENERNLYDGALSSPFSWNDLIGSNKEIEVKKMTTLFFTPSNCKPSGRVEYLWTLLRYDGDENECVVKNKDNLVWTFTKPGYYDVVLDIVDMNGNKANVTKRGVVKVS